MSQILFQLVAEDGAARAGELHTGHGCVPTPAFMPVGTQGTVKTVGSEDLDALGAKIALANTYHLFLRPGTDLLQQFGGLHRFMSYDGALLTDSGGYQVMSLAALNRIDDEGVTFQSHLDGSRHRLTPELSMEIQAAIG